MKTAPVKPVSVIAYEATARDYDEARNALANLAFNKLGRATDMESNYPSRDNADQTREQRQAEAAATAHRVLVEIERLTRKTADLLETLTRLISEGANDDAKDYQIAMYQWHDAERARSQYNAETDTLDAAAQALAIADAYKGMTSRQSAEKRREAENRARCIVDRIAANAYGDAEYRKVLTENITLRAAQIRYVKSSGEFKAVA